MSEQRIDELARKRVKERRKLYQSIGSPVFLVPFFLIIDGLDGYLTWWYWPIFGIAISVLFQIKKVYGFEGARADLWEEKEVEREKKRLRNGGHIDMDAHLDLDEQGAAYDKRDLV